MTRTIICELGEARLERRDFWCDSLVLGVYGARLGAGVWRIACVLRRPAFASLTLRFAEQDGRFAERDGRFAERNDAGAIRSPLMFDLDPEEWPRARVGGDPAHPVLAKTVRLAEAPIDMQLSVAPPLDPADVIAVTVSRLALADMIGIGGRKIVPLLRRPGLLLGKLQHFFSGVGNLALTPAGAGPAEADHEGAYRIWRDIHESPEEEARLRATLDRAIARRPGGAAPCLLAVLLTASGAAHAIESVLQESGPEISDRAIARRPGGYARFRLLILEAPGAPLTPALRDRARAGGAILRRLDTDEIPVRCILDEAQRVGAFAFWLIERAGRLSNSAIEALALAFLHDPDALAVYGDCDRLGGDCDRLGGDCDRLGGDCDRLGPSGRRRQPRFKPEWSPVYARAVNYVGGPLVFRADTATPLCALTIDTPAAAAAGFALLMALEGTGQGHTIRHIPRILFHEAESEGEGMPLARRLAAERAVVERMMTGKGRVVARQTTTDGGGPRLIAYALPAPPPLVSVLIATKDHPDLLERAVASVVEADYPVKEIIIIDNGSVSTEQNVLLSRLSGWPDIRVLRDPSPFNFSALVNRARKAAGGEVLVLLNDDIEAIDGRWLAEMVALALVPDVGCVGALLLYPDDTIQHAGIVLGIHGGAGHAFRGLSAQAVGRDERLGVCREVSAVTGACLAVRAALFDAVSGFDEGFPVTWNDVDFCLKMRGLDRCNLVTPHACLYHRESSTRGLDTTPDRLRRLARETARFFGKWGVGVLDDPYYSPHLTRSFEDFRLRTAKKYEE